MAEIDIADPRATALRHLDDTARSQRLDGTAHRLAADMKHIGEFPFPRQDVAGAQHVGGDQHHQLVSDEVTSRAPVEALPDLWHLREYRAAVHRRHCLQLTHWLDQQISFSMEPRKV
ncbi:hypothetical protein D9M70_456180 [compost metagenome]